MNRVARIIFGIALIGATFAQNEGRADVHVIVPTIGGAFQVGFATRSLDPCPTCPQYLGGFGVGDPVATVHDPLQVRVMAISNGFKTVELAIADTQGWFSGNQEGPWGSHDARVDAAAALGISSGDIIISSTHSHAAPTIMGIWGPTDPDYLKLVHDRTVEALVDAATHLQPAKLYAAEADISDTIINKIEQTDGYQGWRPDGRTPILWARDPVTDATLGMYVNVPVHADVVNGAGLHQISADHIGFERALLDADLGGTAVVAMGTLGRQEGIVQTDGFDASNRLATYVTNEVERALANAVEVTGGQVGSAETYINVPGTNPALAALNYGNAAPGCPCDLDVSWTINRSLAAPYLVGSNFGTWITALRIGDLVYASEPGEAFPEVSTGIRNAFGGAADVRVIGMAQDQLGYYYPPETYPFTFTNPSDHQIYNASLALADANVDAHAANALSLGFTPNPNHETNQFDNPQAVAHPGLQWYPTKREGVAPTVGIDAYTSEAALGDAVSGATLGTGPKFDSCPRSISWSWGQTTTGGGCGQVLSHGFGAPGSYIVTASTTDPRTGEIIRHTGSVTIDPPLTVSVALIGGQLVPSISGGQGRLLGAKWTFSDSTVAWGLHVGDRGLTGTVIVVDGAGNKATTTF
ncbi:MAG: hypothetical protein LC723_10495 [Actinobacteria bacterium]|nr:hypothetical protein [Actinomycetota bacterium]